VRPPRWAVDSGTRVDLDGFGAEFARAWARLQARFLKVECWQSYQEIEANESQAAYRRGDHERCRELLHKEAEGDRPLYVEVHRRGLDFARLRVVQLPITDYLRYELESYRIRAAMGENIEVVQDTSGAQLPHDEVFDFLLFDHDAALVHDYGSGGTGVQSGGWLVQEPAAVLSLEERALALRAEAVPLPAFLDRVEL
jgi:hypothetical protein